MTQIDQLQQEILRELQRYSREVYEKIEVDKKEVAQGLVKELKQTSPKQTGDYRKGWRMKRSRKGWIVHNATDYQLTHLLEKGHAKRGGGRVPAHVHIAPAEEKAIHEFLDRVERAVEK